MGIVDSDDSESYESDSETDVETPLWGTLGKRKVEKYPSGKAWMCIFEEEDESLGIKCNPVQKTTEKRGRAFSSGKSYIWVEK